MGSPLEELLSDLFKIVIVELDDVISRISLGLTSKTLRSSMSNIYGVNYLPILQPKHFIRFCIIYGYLDLLKWFLEEEMKDEGVDEKGVFEIPLRGLTVSDCVLLSIKYSWDNIFDYISEKYEYNLLNKTPIFAHYDLAKVVGFAGHPEWFDLKFPGVLNSILSRDFSLSSYIYNAIKRSHINVISEQKERIGSVEIERGTWFPGNHDLHTLLSVVSSSSDFKSKNMREIIRILMIEGKPKK